MPCHQLTVEEREVISQMHYSGARASAIAQRLRRSPSTIGRELRRNGDSSGYSAVAAKEQTTRRRR
ncbi:MAG: helix-turn-helix domain-containing protein, partial [Planctomycetota bacterium]|nr:helix-turn-helix domain-containing protein [Planctomycetota bacterium]